MTLLTGFDLCRAALAVTDISAPEQSVLMVLAIMANDQAQCWPPINGPTGLTGKTKLSERAVQRAIQRLKDLGHLHRRQLRHGCVYTIHPVTPATETGVTETGDCVTPVSEAPTPATVAPKQPETTISSKASPSPRPARAERRAARWPSDMPPPAGVSEDQWAGFVEHRRAKRHALTPRAYDLLVGKLAKHADAEWPPGRIVDQMVERRWTSFEPEWLPRANEKHNGKRPRDHHQRSGNGFLDACLEPEYAGRS